MNGARRILITVSSVILGGFITLGGLTTAAVAQGSGSGVAHLFPAQRQYPAGYQLLGTNVSSQPGPVVGDANASAARHFVTGATGGAINQSSASEVNIELAQFGSRSDAARFGRGFITDIQSVSGRRAVRHLGSRAIFVTGGCGCGTSGGDLYFWHGKIFASVETWSASFATDLRLAKAIDRKLSHTSA